MTFDDLIQQTAADHEISAALSRRIVTGLFTNIAEAVLMHGDRVNIPQFGVFARRRTKGGIRPVGGVPKEVQPVLRVVFRVSSGARISLPKQREPGTGRR